MPTETLVFRPCVTARLEAKDAAAEGDFEGEITGYGAVFGNVDSQDEIIRKGAFSKTIKERIAAGKVALMIRHIVRGGDVTECIGVIVEAKEDDYGLWFRAKIYKNVQSAQETRAKIKASPNMYGASVGYRILNAKQSQVEGVRRELTELALHEITVTIIPANDKTSVEAKSADGPAAETLTQEEVRALRAILGRKSPTQEPESTDAARESAAKSAEFHSFEAARARRKRIFLRLEGMEDVK